MTVPIRHWMLEPVPRQECQRLLGLNDLGRLAWLNGTELMVFPVNYTLDGADIVLCTDPGEPIAQTAVGVPAAFQVDDLHRDGTSAGPCSPKSPPPWSKTPLSDDGCSNGTCSPGPRRSVVSCPADDHRPERAPAALRRGVISKPAPTSGLCHGRRTTPRRRAATPNVLAHGVKGKTQ